MSETPVFDIAGAMRVVEELARFDWTWTSADVERLAPRVAPIGVNGTKVYNATTTDIDVVMIDLARIRYDSIDDAERDAVRAIFDALRSRGIAEWGAPQDDCDRVLGTVQWILPQVVVELSCHSNRVYFRLLSSQAHDLDADRGRAAADRLARLTDYAAFVDTIPALAQAQLDSWSRADLAPLFTGVGWPIDTGADRLFPEDLVADLESEHIDVSLHASKTEEYMDAERWGFGEYCRVSLSQRLSPEILSYAYASALHVCVDLLGPPPVVSGPDAEAIWRGPELTYTLSSRGSMLFFVVTPTQPTEGLAYWEWKWGDDWNPGDCWQIRTGAENSRFGECDWWVPERPCETWSMLDDYLDRLFPSLAGDLALLTPYAAPVAWGFRVPETPEVLVQGWFADDGAGIEIRNRDSSIVRQQFPVGGASGRTIAGLTKRALRGFGVQSPDDLEVFSMADSETRKLTTFRIGFTR